MSVDVSFDAHSVFLVIASNRNVDSFVRLDPVTRRAPQAVPKPANFLTLTANLLALSTPGRQRRLRKESRLNKTELIYI